MNGQAYSGINYGNMPMMNLGGAYAQSAQQQQQQQGRNMYQQQQQQQQQGTKYILSVTV
jgi:hypothetical protein